MYHELAKEEQEKRNQGGDGSGIQNRSPAKAPFAYPSLTTSKAASLESCLTMANRALRTRCGAAELRIQDRAVFITGDAPTTPVPWKHRGAHALCSSTYILIFALGDMHKDVREL